MAKTQDNKNQKDSDTVKIKSGDNVEAGETDIEITKEEEYSGWSIAKTACLYFFIAVLFFGLLGVIIQQATIKRDQGINIDFRFLHCQST